MKIRPVGTEVFHADGQTHMMKQIITFCSFVKVPKNPLCTMQIAASAMLKPLIFCLHCVIIW